MIEKLNTHFSFTTPASIHDEEALTALELAGRQGAKINEVIEDQNNLRQETENHLLDQDDEIEKHKSEVIPQRVTQEVQKRIEDGSFDASIDQYAGELTARLNNLFGSLPEGSTTLDAELLDMRVGADGETYLNSGEAVRNNIRSIANRFGYAENVIDPAVMKKGICYASTSGGKNKDANYSTTPFIPCEPNEDWYFEGAGHVSVWDANGYFLKGQAVASGGNFTINTGDGACYIVASVYNTFIPISMLIRGGKPNHFITHKTTISGTSLDERQFDRSRFVDALMDNMEVQIPVTWRLGGMQGDGTTVDENLEHQRTEMFSVDPNIRKFRVRTLDSQPVWVACYDNEQNFAYGYPAWAEEIEVNNNYAYYIVTQRYQGSIYERGYEPGDRVSIAFNLLTDMRVSVESDNGKLPYESGFIPFTVSVDNVDVDCHLRLPASYSAVGKPCKLLMICHGAGRGITGEENWTTILGYNRIVNKFIENGYAVFDCNGYGNDALGWNHWGCNRGLEGYRKAYDYVVTNYNVDTNVNVYGFSMGGLTAINLITQGLPNVKCLGLGSPVINLYNKCWENGIDSAFVQAYDMTGGVYVPDKVVGNDPYERIVTIADVPYFMGTMPTVKVWFGALEDADSSVNKAYGIMLTEAIKNGGGSAIYREVAGGGHEICYGSNTAVVDEIYDWFSRFND